MQSDQREQQSLVEDVLSSPFERRILRGYRKLFSLREIVEDSVLQWVFGATLFSFFVSFYDYIGQRAITVESFAENTHRCWSYFQSCGEYYFLSQLPHGYSQTILYMFFFAVMVAIVYAMWKRDWLLAHMLMVILFIWKFLIMFVLTDFFTGNYDYYHILFAAVILFIPFKLFFLKLVFVLLYFLAATIKIHEGWILGTYFTSLTTGLPIFPQITTPLWTNLVIFMQMVGAWFLFSSNPILQRGALIYFAIFHLYSGILVEYRYPATVMPTLLILFGPMYRLTKIPVSWPSFAGWGIVSLMILLQLSSVFIAGDEKMTLEGNKYGLYMFEANHQCVIRADVHYQDGTIVNTEDLNIRARNRCNPYLYWFRLNQACKRDDTIDRITMDFDHSINGGPFYRIISEPDICSVEYKQLQHNDWIKTPEEGAPVIGYPLENYYY